MSLRSVRLSRATPAPGLASPRSLPVSIDTVPSVTVDRSITAPGETVAVTLHDGLGVYGTGSARPLLAPPTRPTWNGRMWVRGSLCGPGRLRCRPPRHLRDSSLPGRYVCVATSAPIVVDASRNPSPRPLQACLRRVFLPGADRSRLTVNGSGFNQSSTIRWNGLD